ncbi:MAG: hypothetical protein ACTICW_02650 [Lacticaseibacillus paracasei]
MRKWLVVAVSVIAMIGVTGCQSKSSKSSSSAGSTMIKVNHFTKQTLQKQYTTISDLVMKTMTEVSLQSDNKTLSQSAKASLSKLDKIRLELDNNKSQDSGDDALAKTLVDYAKQSSDVLTAVINNDGKGYQSSAQAFFKQAVSIGQQSFGGQVPESVRNYANNQQAVTNSGSSK